MADQNSNSPKSTFVTALAWVFIVLGGFATVIAILQNVMLGIMMPAGTPPIESQDQNVPAFATFMFNNFRLFFAGFLLISAITLASAIGLLKRINWARLTFVGLMGFGILWNVASVVLTYLMFSAMPYPDSTPTEFREQHELMTNIMSVVTVLMAVGFTALFGWIIKRLLSDDIKQEFVAR